MGNLTANQMRLPPEQQAIQVKSFHPSGTFVGFPIEDVETSIPARFEKMVRLFSHHRVAACGFPTSYRGLIGAQL